MADVDRTSRSPSLRQPSPAGADPELDPRREEHASSSPPPPFEPLFTLLTNTTTNTTVHPRVHYLFTDDDTSLLANAASDPSHRSLIVDLVPAAPSAPPPSGAPSSSTATSPQPQPPQGWAVSWASSLSADFAVTGSSLALHQGDGDGDGGAMMLRVEGVEREPVDLRAGEASLPNSGSGTVGREDVDALVDDFKRRMAVLKKVVGEGETRRDAVSRDMQEDKDEEEEEEEEDPVPGEKEEVKEDE